MYDIKWIREHPDAFDRGLRRRSLNDDDRERFSSQALLAIDEQRRKALYFLEQALARRNGASKEIAEAKRKKDEAHADDLMIEVSQLKKIIPELEKTPREIEAKLNRLLAQIPNVPADDVPDGADASGNVVLAGHTHAEEKKLVDEKGQAYLRNERGGRFAPKQHFELGEALGMMDFELAAKLSGARFVVLQSGLARLERALGQFMLDVHTRPIRKSGDVEIGGYTEVNPPLLVRDEVMFGTAQLPKFKEDQFEASALIFDEEPIEWTGSNEPIFDDEKTLKRFEDSKNRGRKSIRIGGGARRYVVSEHFWLIPTAEVPLTNLVRESIVEEAQLPIRLTACTPCFRAEAGAAGKDTRGMIRQHQFTKVELVSIVTPEKSKDEHERMLACAEEVLKKLDLHYRVVTLCTGDMGFAAQKTYDIEVWLPGQGAYREISSCSNCGEFQARRMNARYRPGRLVSGGALIGAAMPGRAGFNQPPVRAPLSHVHTLNGSGVAVGRALIAVMETYQQDNGAIVVPEALKPYMGGVSKIEKGQ